MPLQFATRLDNVETSAIRELFKLLGKPGIISFAGGFPDSAMFDVEGLRAASQQALAQEPGAALQYGATEGFEPLRTELVEHAERSGTPLVGAPCGKPSGPVATSDRSPCRTRRRPTRPARRHARLRDDGHRRRSRHGRHRPTRPTRRLRQRPRMAPRLRRRRVRLARVRRWLGGCGRGAGVERGATGEDGRRAAQDGPALHGVTGHPEDVVITHLHYDHAGNFALFPRATLHVQDLEMRFATGRKASKSS